MSWNPRHNQKKQDNNNNNKASSNDQYSVSNSDDDVKMGIARPRAMESSDDDDSYYDRHHRRNRGRRSHLLNQASFKDDRSGTSTDSPPTMPSTTTALPIRNAQQPYHVDEKEIYRQASDLIDQHASSHTNRSMISTASTANTFNPRTSADEKEIYRQASDLIDQFASSRNLTTSTAEQDEETYNNWVLTPGAAMNTATTATSTPLMSSINPTEHAVAPSVDTNSARRPGAFAIPGPGSAHDLVEAQEESSTVASHQRPMDMDEILHEKGNTARLPNLAPATLTPASSGRQQRQPPPQQQPQQRPTPVPGAQHVRGIAPGVPIAMYLDQMRRENSRALIHLNQPPVPEPAAEPTVPIQPVEETYPTDAEQDKDSRRKWYILAAVVVCAVIGGGIVIGVAVAGGGSSNSNSNTNSNSSTTSNNGNLPPTPTPTTTQFNPFTSDCQLLRTQTAPNVLSQCICNGKVKTLPKDVAALYDVFRQSFAPTFYPYIHETTTSCSAPNQALIWLASGDGGVSASSDKTFLQQRYGLALLFILWNGVNWTKNFGWMSSSSECSWSGIGCNDQHQVVSVALSHINVVGPLPAETALLTNLQTLDLSSNKITGGIDSRLGVLTQLQTLNLDYNYLNGTLPTELGLMTSLQLFQIASNRIHGTIPPEYGSLQNLVTLDMSNNTLMGNFPKELGSWAVVETIDFEMNQLNSTLPSEVGMMTNLLTLNLRWNAMHGSIPSELSSLNKTIQTVNLGKNKLSGTIPSQIGQLTQLQSLWIDSNNITGTIPSELGSCKNLVVLDVSNNQLHGTLPAELGHLVSISSLNLDGNQLTGAVPEPVCYLIQPISCIPTLKCVLCNCQCYPNKK